MPARVNQGVERTIDVVALLTGCLMWGLAWWPMQSLGAGGLDGPRLALTAYGAAAICLLPTVVRQWATWLPAWRPLLAITFTGGIWNVCEMTAMVEGHASRVVVLLYLSSGWAIVGGRIFFRETIDGRRWLSVILVMGGAYLVLREPRLAQTELSRADLLAIAAGIAHAATNLMFRSLERVPLAAKNLAMFIGTILTAWLALETPPAGASNPAAAVLLAGAAFGAVWLLLAETLTQHGVSRLPATRSSLLLIAELPITVVSAAIIANERPGPIELAGGALIMLATLIDVLRPPSTADAADDLRGPGIGEPAVVLLKRHARR